MKRQIRWILIFHLSFKNLLKKHLFRTTADHLSSTYLLLQLGESTDWSHLHFWFLHTTLNCRLGTVLVMSSMILCVLSHRSAFWGTHTNWTHLKPTKNFFVLLIIFRVCTVILETYLCFKYTLHYIKIVVNKFIYYNFYMSFTLLSHVKSKMKRHSSH